MKKFYKHIISILLFSCITLTTLSNNVPNDSIEPREMTDYELNKK